MAADFHLKRGDTLPKLTLTLVNEATSTGYDITGYTSITYWFKNVATASTASRAGVAVDAATGSVQYQLVTGDWDWFTVGEYELEVKVVIPDGKITFPTEGYKRLKIEEDLE